MLRSSGEICGDVLEKQMGAAFETADNIATVTEKTGRIGRALGSSTGAVVAGGVGTTALLLGMLAGPVGLGVAFAAFVVGLIGGGKGGKALAQGRLNRDPKFRVFGKEGLKEETIEQFKELFRKYVVRDPFLNSFDLSHLKEFRESQDQTDALTQLPDHTQPLLAVLIQHRLIRLFGKITKQEKLDDTDQLKKLLEICCGEVKEQHAEARDTFYKALDTIRKRQFSALEGNPSSELCQKLALLLWECRTLEYNQLFNDDIQKNHAELRQDLLEKFKPLQKTLAETELGEEIAEQVHAIEGDIAKLLEIHISDHGKQGLSVAVNFLRDKLAKIETTEGVVEQFNLDYIKHHRLGSDIFLYEGDEQVASLVVRVGIQSGNDLLTSLESFASDDTGLFHALQMCLSQCGDIAFLRAAVSDVTCCDTEELSRTVRRQSETRVEVTIAARVIRPDPQELLEGKRAVLAHQRVAVTCVLIKKEDKWTLEEAEVKEREMHHYVTNIPELELDEEELVVLDLKKMCEEKGVFVQRESIVPGSKEIGSLYNTPDEVDAIPKEAGLSSKKWLRRMIGEATGREIKSFELEEKRVISRDGEDRNVTKLGGGSVTFEGNETLYFPYRETIFPDGKRTLDPLFLTDVQLCWEV